MHPNLFVQLSFVRGFNGMNGDTYQDHIVLVLGEILTDSQKKTILATRTPDDALVALENMGINYTHTFNE
jgi:hypothetical protein